VNYSNVKLEGTMRKVSENDIMLKMNGISDFIDNIEKVVEENEETRKTKMKSIF
jgi:hypothetical protein